MKIVCHNKMKTFLELILIIIFTFSFNVSSLENGEFSSKVLLENLMIRETTQQDLHSIGSSPALKIPKMIQHQSENQGKYMYVCIFLAQNELQLYY